ncbi:asparagine synthase [Caulobacter flavus]|uniref:Asparagine synthase n=1 Tax=Caulobacter flavus TaxID=1679497 RepID=A0A2N5CNZ5_9CAUL|nr:asparagine synthase C-terminal domain-containing protein [Caulobacter flavus]AYV48614.1 asparagine synthase [Caulobacter flavus]PLR08670.1 asparagine synthase [Caulobacter flavus]
MRDYLVIETQAGSDLSAWREAESLVLATGAWKKVAERRWFSVFLEQAQPATYRHLPGVGGSLIGEVFDVQAARSGLGRDLELMGFGTEPEGIARRLVARGFGRYVAILNDDHGPAQVLRDPLGAMDAIGWRRGSLRFIGSRLPDLPALWPADLEIDWAQVATILRQKNLASHLCPLVGVTSYPSGVLAGPEGRGPRLWSPARLAAAPWRDAPPEALRSVVDGVVAAWSYGREGVFCEISGGLDSAIVASSLAQVQAPLIYGVNHTFPFAESDEQVYARAVADRVGVPLVVVERDMLRIEPEKLVAAAGGPRPNYLGGDPDHDADLAARLSQNGVEAMFTGRGGDAMLYQSANPALVRDVLAGASAGGRLRGLEILARRHATTVWSMLKRGLANQDLTAGLGVQLFLSPAAAARLPDLHPWLAEARDLKPAKQLQVLALVNGLSAFGESQRSRSGLVIDPLMSQPVVEFCLSLAAGRLAVGANDRPFARCAFADRLPEAVFARRGKGALSAYFAQSLALSLDAVRPYLLEGELAAAGLLDLASLDAALLPERLIWTNLSSEIFILLALEAWVRCWRERIAQASGPTDQAGHYCVGTP